MNKIPVIQKQLYQLLTQGSNLEEACDYLQLLRSFSNSPESFKLLEKTEVLFSIAQVLQIRERTALNLRL